jgi:anhydro-N-acetylmuramic acid kinase
MKPYTVAGLMSGSSLDGLDIACVRFSGTQEKLDWEMAAAPTTIPIPDNILESLKQLHMATDLQIEKLNTELGKFYGQAVSEYVKSCNLELDLVASHGHTVRHNPHEGYSLQIGDGDKIAQFSNTPSMTQFRSVDIQKRGQGAPLAPVVEHYLFGEYKLFLNLGGISNVSFHTPERIIAFDVCPANQLLNHICIKLGVAYDDKGKHARAGRLDSSLLDALNSDPYHDLDFPKSLDNNYVRNNFIKKLNTSESPVRDKLCTCVHYIVKALIREVSAILVKQNIKEIFVTGGGAYNEYLIELLQQNLGAIKVHIPSDEIIQHKESILMALCGYLALNEKPNSFASATGASHDTINGVLHQP